jgi:hypothetical protein
VILDSILLAAIGAGALLLRLRLGTMAARSRTWQEAARECGVTDLIVGTVLGLPVAVDGRKGTLGVRITSYGDLTRQSGTRMHLSGLPTTLTLVRTPVSFLGEVLPTQGLVTGDEGLDAIVEVSGDALTAHAVFDAPTRRLAREIFGVAAASTGEMSWPDASLRGGTLTGTCADWALGGRTSREARYLHELLGLAERLAAVRDLEASVAEMAAADPVPGVRHACLAALVEERPRHPETREALLRALQDEDERVQLTAALALGSEGRAVLLDIARREWSNDACAARAVAELRAHLPAADAEHALAIGLRGGKQATIAACLESLARRGDAHLAPIARVLAVERGGRAVAAAQALGHARGAEAERLLVRALAHSDGAVRLAAATSLGRVGTAVAVAALREAETAHARDAAFVRAARASIASIQLRLTGADHGQLALASDSGELSLADDAAGRVTVEDAS